PNLKRALDDLNRSTKSVALPLSVVDVARDADPGAHAALLVTRERAATRGEPTVRAVASAQPEVDLVFALRANPVGDRPPDALAMAGVTGVEPAQSAEPVFGEPGLLRRERAEGVSRAVRGRRPDDLRQRFEQGGEPFQRHRRMEPSYHSRLMAHLLLI